MAVKTDKQAEKEFIKFSFKVIFSLLLISMIAISLMGLHIHHKQQQFITELTPVGQKANKIYYLDKADNSLYYIDLHVDKKKILNKDKNSIEVYSLQKYIFHNSYQLKVKPIQANLKNINITSTPTHLSDTLDNLW